jgi:hypothetical protein
MTIVEFPACRTTKCAHKVCKRASADPKAAGWVYLNMAPVELPHWIGWWCRACFDELRKLLASPEFRQAAGAALADRLVALHAGLLP